MRISEIFRLVWLNLSQNKFKVVLTSIGIIVGSATIMMVIAIGTGSKEEVAAQFKNLNAGAIDISYEGGSSIGFSMGGDSAGGGADMGGGGSMTFSMDMGGGSVSVGGDSFSGGSSMGGFSISAGGDMGGGGFSMSDIFSSISDMFGSSSTTTVNEEVTLTEDDCEDLLTFVPGITDATISYSTTTSVEGGDLDSASYYTVAGVLYNYGDISNLELAIGDFISEENNESKEKVCVLGATVAKSIFGSAYDAYNETLSIDGRSYVVVGVLSEMGSVSSGISPDSAIFIPYNTGIKYIVGTSISPTITVIAEDVNNVDTVMEYLEAELLEIYPNTTFTLSDAGSKMEAATASNETLTLLLIAMSVIVFIVGGIGIMNVLFVSVKERTNEIGILKALGCTRGDILLEFLLEASCISFVGGVIGVLLSLGITPLVQMFNVSVSLSFQGALLSLLFGVVTGSIFGFYPAFKASRLIPVVALNAE